MSTSKRKCLTLEERVKCLKLLESGKSTRTVASEIGVGRTQVQNVLKRKREILDEYETKENINSKRPKVKTEYGELNDLIYKWFCDSTARMMPVSGPMIQLKAKKFAADLGLETFKASNGWLQSFLKRHGIVFKVQSGERGEVKSDTVIEWKDSIKDVCEGYSPDDIFNMDETGLFFKDTTRSTFFKKGEKCSGGKRSKQRLTVALCASMTGEKLKPLVIGKAQKPRCFGALNVASLPVKYCANPKAWMLTPVMVDWLQSLDRMMKAQNRKILLLLDNAPVHPKITLQNVKLQFLPANTTSILQPMDAGIIQTLKLKYRTRQLQHVITQMDKHLDKTGCQVLRDITVLDAIYWVAGSWREVQQDTIIKCFAKCGFTPEVLSSQDVGAADAVGTNDCDTDLEDSYPLVFHKAARELFGCELGELLEIDQKFDTCDNSMTDWDRPAQEILSEAQTVLDAESEDEDTPPPPEVTTNEARECIDKLKNYAISKGQHDMLNNLMDVEDGFFKTQLDISKQKKISDFFKKC